MCVGYFLPHLVIRTSRKNGGACSDIFSAHFVKKLTPGHLRSDQVTQLPKNVCNCVTPTLMKFMATLQWVKPSITRSGHLSYYFNVPKIPPGFYEPFYEPRPHRFRDFCEGFGCFRLQFWPGARKPQWGTHRLCPPPPLGYVPAVNRRNIVARCAPKARCPSNLWWTKPELLFWREPATSGKPDGGAAVGLQYSRALDRPEQGTQSACCLLTGNLGIEYRLIWIM